MTVNDFWQLIETARAVQTHPSHLNEAIAKLEDLLEDWSPQEMESFEKILREELQALFRSEIVELYLILENDFHEQNGRIVFNPYVSEDSFLYFRCWLILQGEACCRDIVSNPENILKFGVDISNTWGEGLLYVADNAYARHHGNDDGFAIRDAVSFAHPELDYDFGGYKMKGEVDNMELDRKYPNLVAAIRRLRG